MRVLALDIATMTGWAWGDDRSTPVFGTWKLPGLDEKSRAKSLGGLYAAVLSTVRDNAIKHVAIEHPGQGRNSSHTQLSLTLLVGAAQAAAFNAGAQIMKMPQPQSWRKQVLGKGILKNAKLAALDYCRLHGWQVVDHNAAEALCIWQWAHGQTSLLDRIIR